MTSKIIFASLNATDCPIMNINLMLQLQVVGSYSHAFARPHTTDLLNMMKELKFAVRITRAQSNSSSRLGAISPSLELSLKELHKRGHAANSERAQLDGSNAPATITVGIRRKRRAVLKDVTNMSYESNNLGCLHASKIQVQIFHILYCQLHHGV